MADIITPYTKEALIEQGWTFEDAYIPDPPIHDDRIFEIELPTSASDTYTTIPSAVSSALVQAVRAKKIIVVKPTEENDYADGEASFVAYATYEDSDEFTNISLDISVTARTMLSIAVNHPNDLETETARVYVSENTIDNLDDRIFEIELPTLASDTFTTIPSLVSGALLQAVDDKKIIVVKPTEENTYPDGKASFVAYATYSEGEHYTHISLCISVASRTMLDIQVNHPNDFETETARVYVSENTIDNRDDRIFEFDLTNGINAEGYEELSNALSSQRLVFIRFRGRTSVVPASVVGVGYISLYGFFNEAGLQQVSIYEDNLEMTVRSLSDYERIRVAVSRGTTTMGTHEFEKLFEAADLGKGISVYDTITQTTMPAAYTKGKLNSENMLPEFVVITVFAPQVFTNQTVYDRMFRVYAQNKVGSGFTLSIREFRSVAYNEITS